MNRISGKIPIMIGNRTQRKKTGSRKSYRRKGWSGNDEPKGVTTSEEGEKGERGQIKPKRLGFLFTGRESKR